MPSILNSDDGVVSGTSGLKTTGGNDGLLNIQTNGSNAISISAGQRSTFPTTIGVGGATPSTSGSGISFPATQSASSDANTLDDYEEGTWTPTVSGTTVAGTGTYSTQSGRYVKVGKLIFINIRLGWSAHTGTGNLQLTNLPFTSAVNNYAALSVAFNDGLTIPAGSILNLQISPSSTTIIFASLATGGSTSSLAMDTTCTDLNFSGCYETSD